MALEEAARPFRVNAAERNPDCVYSPHVRFRALAHTRLFALAVQADCGSDGEITLGGLRWVG
jgi:hypothetical protein